MSIISNMAFFFCSEIYIPCPVVVFSCSVLYLKYIILDSGVGQVEHTQSV